jgi:predicted nucleic-acid-binding Zn-ribbon protein
LCGETFSRVVDVEKDDKVIKACGRCRDRHGLS